MSISVLKYCEGRKSLGGRLYWLFVLLNQINVMIVRAFSRKPRTFKEKSSKSKLLVSVDIEKKDFKRILAARYITKHFHF